MPYYNDWVATTRLNLVSTGGSGGFHTGMTVRLGGSDQIYWGLYQSSSSNPLVLNLERSGTNNISIVPVVSTTVTLRISYTYAAGACQYTFSYQLPGQTTFVTIPQTISQCNAQSSAGLMTKTYGAPQAVTTDFDWFDLRVIPGQSPCTTADLHTDDFDLARNGVWREAIPQPGPVFSLTSSPGCEELSVPLTRTYDAWTGIDNAPELLRSDEGGPGTDWTASTRLILVSANSGPGAGGFHTGLVVRLGGSDQIYWGLYQRLPSNPLTLALERSGGNSIATISGVTTTITLRVSYAYAGGACRYSFGYQLPDQVTMTMIPQTISQCSDQGDIGLLTKTYGAPRAVTTDFDWFDLLTAPTPTSGVIPWHPHRSVRMANGLGASVDLADGHVDVSADEMHLPARGSALAMGQTWDSVAAQAGVTTAAGQGWSSSLSPSIGGAITGTLTFTDDTGAAWPLTYTGSLSADGPYTAYSPPPGMPWQLTVATAPTTAYTLTDFLTGATMSFNGQGRLVATGDAYGNENHLQFTGDPGPSSVVNDGGRSMRFLYGTNGLLSDVKSPLWVSGGSGQAGSQHVAYGYAPGTTQLQTITTAAGTGQDLTTTFGYSGALLTSVTTPYTQTARAWSIAYDAQGRVASISSPLSGTLGQPGYTPTYTTAFTYIPGRTVMVAGVGTTAALTTTYDLDAQGQPIAVTDGLTNRTAYAYDQNHDITRVTNARGNVTTNSYAYVGQYGSTGLVTETDRPGIAAYIPTNATSPVTTTYRYDPTTYDLLERDTAEGARTVYSYDGPRHQVTSVIDRLSSLSPCRQSFAVAQARPSRTISGAQARPSRTIVGTQARTSRTISGVHKSGGRPRQIAPHLRPHTDCAPTGDRWRGTITAYDAWGQLVATTDARGVIVPDTSIGQTPVATLNPTPPVAATRTYTYTPAGDLWSVSSPPLTTLNPTDPGQTTGPVTTTYGYDADGNQLTVTSPNGAVTTAGYDHLGRLTQLMQPPTMLFDGSTRAPTTAIDYDGDGNVVRTTDGAGDPTTRAYDPLGRLTSSTNAVGETTALTYTATRLAQVLTPAGNLTSYGYDAAGRRTGVTDPIGTLTRFGLDAVGNTTAITVPLDTQGASSVEVHTYDGLNQLVTDTVGGSGELTATAPQTTTSSYDHDGNLVQAQAPNGDVTYRTYDYADQPRAVTVYPSGALAPVTNAPPAASQTFSLDPAGHLTDQLDFNQRDHAYTLDGAGRTTQRVDSYSGQTLTAITTTVGYDPNGNVRTLSRQADGVSGTQTQASTATYNALDWLTSQDDGQGATTYGYDAAGRPRTQSLLGGTASMTATLDAAGRTTAIDDNAAGSVATSLFSYTLDDRPYTATLGVGAANVQETRQYDANDRLLCSQTGGPTVSGQLLALSYAYAYSPLGVTTAISAYNATTCGGAPPSAAQTLGYDAHGRLVSASGVAWGYDRNGNLTSVSRAPAVAGTQPISQT